MDRKSTPDGSLDAQSVLRSPNAAAITPSERHTTSRLFHTGCSRRSGGGRVRGRRGRTIISCARVTGCEAETKRRRQGCRGAFVQCRVGSLSLTRRLDRARSDGADGANGTAGWLRMHLPRGRRVSSPGGGGRGHRLLGVIILAEDRVNTRARRGRTGCARRRLKRRAGLSNVISATLDWGLGHSERINAARRWATDTSGRCWGSTPLALRSWVVIRKAARREEGGAFVAVQSPMLAS